MTLKEFLRELRKLRGGWEVRSYGAIRCEKGDCPITAVARARGYGYGVHDYEKAAKALGLRADRDVIVSAADRLNIKGHAALRRSQLLHALGLEEAT